MRSIKDRLDGNDYDTPMFPIDTIDMINDHFKEHKDVHQMPIDCMDDYTTDHKTRHKDRDMWSYNQVIDFLDDYTDKIKSDNDLEYDVVFMSGDA